MHSHFPTFPTRLLSLATFLAFVLASTCALAFDISGTLEVANAPARLINQKRVYLFEATGGAPIERGVGLSNGNGDFTISSAVDVTDSVFFLMADVRPRVRFVSVLGGELPAAAVINEFTTVAASYAFAQFYRTGQISGDAFRLYIANEMYGNLADSITGNISDVLLTAPNANETSSLKMFRSLANLLNRCAVDPDIARAVLNATKQPGEPRPTDTAVAIANLARDPGRNVARLFLLTTWRQPFTPALVEVPDAWCVTVKVNDSGGTDAQLFGGPANVAFDARGYAWIPNNVPQGSPDSGDYLIVLQPNGKPADGTNGSPVSPITGGGIKGGGWGIAIGPDDFVWASNFGWGMNVDGNWPQLDPEDGTGSVSLIRAEDGVLFSEPMGFYGGVWRAQAIQVQDNGDVWIASLENDSAVVYKGGDPLNSKSVRFYDGAQPFGILPLGDGSAWVSNSGGLAGEQESSIAKIRFNIKGELETTLLKPVGNTIRVIMQDSYGNIWLASNGDSSVYAFDADGNELGRFQRGGIDGPWGLAVDGEDNIWVANFSDIEVVDDYGPGRISKLWGANEDIRPRRANLGDPISPDTGYTVRSGGSPVTLHNGDPLYGEGAPPSFVPMMRQTSLQIDAAGNIWSINNWKPSDFNNLIVGNPGGDGVVIYVGIAPPPNKL